VAVLAVGEIMTNTMILSERDGSDVVDAEVISSEFAPAEVWATWALAASYHSSEVEQRLRERGAQAGLRGSTHVLGASSLLSFAVLAEDADVLGDHLVGVLEAMDRRRVALLAEADRRPRWWRWLRRHLFGAIVRTRGVVK
jgi:hypothetical protein